MVLAPRRKGTKNNSSGLLPRRSCWMNKRLCHCRKWVNPMSTRKAWTAMFTPAPVPRLSSVNWAMSALASLKECLATVCLCSCGVYS